MNRRRILAGSLVSVLALLLAACTFRLAPAETERWSGLQYDPRSWRVTVDASEEALGNILQPSCRLTYLKGGEDLPPGWSVENDTVTLGSNVFDVFEVHSPDRLEYANYFYDSGDPAVNLGGFQVQLPVSDAQACIEAAQGLLAKLDPEAMGLPTGTPAG